MVNLDYQKLASELAKAVRGSTAQTILNKKLHYTTNQIYRWESGYSDIYWQDFIKVCEYKKINVADILKVELGYVQATANSSEFIKHLCGQSQIKEFSKACDLTTSVISKWINQKTEPKLFHILQIIDKAGFMMADFMIKFTKADQLPSIAPLLKKFQDRRELFYSYPIIGFIMSAVGLNDFRTGKVELHEMIQRQFDLSKSEIQNLITALIKNDILRLNVDGKVEISDMKIDTRGDLAGSIKLKKYWLDHASLVLNTIHSLPTPHLYPHFIMSVSEEGNKKLLEATYQYVSAIKEIGQNDNGRKTQIRMVNIQTVNLIEKIK